MTPRSGQSREAPAYRIDAARTDFIRTWRVSRALPSAGKLEGLAYPLAPLDLTERIFTGHFCDLHKDLFNCAPDDVFVYMACRIVCPEAMKLDICLGYDGPVKLWVDGQEKFHDPNGTNPATIDSVAIRHEASAGIHEVMIALGSNHGKAWGLFLRLKRPDVPNTAHCLVYPAVPTRLSLGGEQGCSARVQGDSVFLSNGYLAAEIPLRMATIRSIRNKITNQTFALNGDQTGFAAAVDGGETVAWSAGADAPGDFSAQTAEGPDAASVVFTARAGTLSIAVSYEIRREHFWLERRLAVEGGAHRLDFDRLVYGRLDVSGSHARILELGKFDCPRLLTV
ncbi:MAG: hypothetical protein HY343_05430, partial [Lentisphaerae bacterium]|nr:hypothetical protein [Lentisphaerota bacterium]